MTGIPRPNDEENQLYDAVYDGWNRLVKLSRERATVAEYRYDGQHKRIAKLVPAGENTWVRTDWKSASKTDPPRHAIWPYQGPGMSRRYRRREGLSRSVPLRAASGPGQSGSLRQR
jgi:YD repeat-containing protein